MESAKILHITRFTGFRLLLHLLFWAGVSAFFTLFFGHFSGNYHFTVLFVGLLLPVAISTTYFIIYWLIPRYLLRRRHGKFAVYFLFTMIISVWLEMLVMIGAFIKLADYRYGNMNPLTGDIFLLAAGLYFVVFFSASIKLLKHWYSSQKEVSELRSRQLEAELKLKEVELQLLKGQIHPHFLFNTLNNLYGLALEQSDQVPDSIIRLSSLLDALLYRSKVGNIKVEAELKLIEDYIALEKLRVADRLLLCWEVNPEVEECLISPFLLFPFIENAFKHGFAHNPDKLWLEVKGALEGQELMFSVANSICPSPKGAAAEPSGGMGLQNLRRRLELLYPKQHTLHIDENKDVFYIQLRISLTADKTKSYAIS